ncbi:MAG: prepilin-type N-terminal cleavage/methylation domain-containing protein [Verrucomicrobiae bacterium]|nr:prepilin-type N-terminal cleavage/methylation domain-containing protein [Verrucomicrobiae bacterium]
MASTSCAFTMVELLTVIAILSVLAAQLLVALKGVREKARQITCMNNLKQYGAASLMYAGEHEDHLPVYYGGGFRGWWGGGLKPYNIDTSKLKCPAGKSSDGSAFTGGGPQNGYASNSYLMTEPNNKFGGGFLGQVPFPEKTIMFGESSFQFEVIRTYYFDQNRHAGGSMVCFVDGHVEYLKYGTMWPVNDGTGYPVWDLTTYLGAYR